MGNKVVMGGFSKRESRKFGKSKLFQYGDS